jgi:hypothetical protein
MLSTFNIHLHLQPIARLCINVVTQAGGGNEPDESAKKKPKLDGQVGSKVQVRGAG